MTPRAAEYARRRGALQLRATSQRHQMEQAIAVIEADLDKFNRGLAMVRRIRISPLVVAAGAALALGLGTGRTVGFLSRAWLLFNSLQRLRRTVLPRE
jgi:YqjK-like protein